MQYIEGEDERDLCSAAREELVYEAQEGFLGQQGSFEEGMIGAVVQFDAGLYGPRGREEEWFQVILAHSPNQAYSQTSIPDARTGRFSGCSFICVLRA